MVGFFFSVSHVFAATGINKQINFQGKVVNVDGTNVANGDYDFVFKLYSVASGGSPVWTETWNSGTSQVTVTDGVFQVNLGTHTTLPGSIDFNTDNIYLGVTFHTDSEMTPRVRFTAVPYAFNADKIHGLSVTDTTGTLTLANGKTVQFGDAFTTSGAFPLTLTATASTTATLPSGTITLADTATGQTLTNKIIGSTGLVFSGAATDITTATDESLVIAANGTGIVDVQDALTADSLTIDTGGVSIAAGQSYAGAGAVMLSSGGSAGLTIDSASGVVAVATGDYLSLSHSGVSGAAAGYFWYDSSDNKFKVNENGTTKVLCNTTDGSCGGGVAANSLDFTEFKDAMALDANTTINANTGASQYGLTLVSDLSVGSRSSSVFSITQADNATYDFDTSYEGLLKLTNNDSGSEAPLLYLDNNSSIGTAITIDVISNGLGIYSPVANIQSGSAVYYGGSASGISAFTGGYFIIAPIRTHNSTSTISDSGNFLRFSRDDRVNNASGTYNITGDLVTFSSSLTKTSGNINDSSNILSLAQNCGTGATCSGSVFESTNAGTGNSADFLMTNAAGTQVNGLYLNRSGAGTTTNAIRINEGAGAITNGLSIGSGVGTAIVLQNSETIDNTTDGTLSFGTDSGALTLSLSGVAVISNTSGGLTLDANSGVVSVATGDYLSLSHSGVSGAAAGYFWYDSSDNKFKVNENGTTKVLCNTTDAGCGAGGGTTWDTIGDAVGSGAIAMGQTAQTMDWVMSSDTAVDGLTFTFTNGLGTDTNTQNAVTIANLNDSTTTGTLETMLHVDNRDVNEAVTNGILVEQTGAGTITNAISVLKTAGTITTGINIGNGVATGISIGTGVTTGISIASGGITSTGEVNLTNTGSGNSLVVNDQSADTTPFVIDQSGNVGVGTSTPSRVMDIFQSASAPQLRLSKDLTNYSEFTTDAVGDLQLSASGGDIRATTENLWVCDGGACPALTLTGQGNIFVENAVKFGNGFTLTNSSSTELTVSDSTDTEVLVFDQS